MKKKKKQKKLIFNYGLMKESNAIVPEVKLSGNNITRVSIKKHLSKLQKEAKNLPQGYPHKNKILGLSHFMNDKHFMQVKDQFILQKRPVVCKTACDSCCYYSDIVASGTEFEEIIRYTDQLISTETKTLLKFQITKEPNYIKLGYQPCPFLLRIKGSCSIYPVRPNSCRTWGALKKCELDIEEDTGNQEVQKMLQFVMNDDIPPGLLILLQEEKRKGKIFADIDRGPGETIYLKRLEPEKLEKLFSIG